MAKILVTGGAGFIGSHLVAGLAAAGHSVSVLDDLSSGCRENLPPEIGLNVLDIRTAAARDFLRAEQPELLIHAAAQMSVSESMKNPHFDTEVNVCGLINLLQAFQGEKLPYVVFISTGGAIYGEQECYPAPEEHPIRPTSVYGLAKYVSELYLDLWQREFGLQYGVLRLANVYGPRQNPHGEAGVVAIINRVLLAGGTPTIFGSGEQTRDFVYVGDVAAAVKALVTQRKQGTFNIGTGVETSVNTLYGLICRALGREIRPTYAAARPGEQQRSCIAAERARQQLGWQVQVPLAEGVALTSAWFREQA